MSIKSPIMMMLSTIHVLWAMIWISPVSCFFITHTSTSTCVTQRVLRRQTVNTPLHVLPNDYYFGNGPSDGGGRMNHKSNKTSTATLSRDFTSALAIVPPLAHWDRLQRARHFARDPVFHEWPPCIRLFHPFDAGALEVADVVEALGLEPFEIVLDTWVIVPHMEALEAEWQNAQAAPPVEHSELPNPYKEEEEKVRQLIQSEEQKARGKAKARRKSPKKLGAETKPKHVSAAEEKKSPAQIMEEQKQQYEDFGGPCILCLEPNAKSKQRLIELREELAQVLDHSDYFSASSVFSWKLVEDPNLDMGFRPLIPMGSFESLQSALDVARRLKGLWGEPLKWNVQELQLISCREENDEEYTAQSAQEWNQVAWGRSAEIKLLGAEVEQDEDANEDMVRQLVEEGDPGGMDISSDFTILEDEETPSDIEMWLDQDDEWDEGAQIIIGRTHFYSAEQRDYIGMPATSMVDAKDRALGEGGAVSGLARRRRTTSRQGTLWNDGEYGRRDNDYLPWSKKEKPKKIRKAGYRETEEWLEEEMEEKNDAV
jgi:hypothetical protein